jgi:predicted molibdopterin-dependent oxidoreductase YjgC
MCDIGRFEYHWIEGDDRLRKPLVREERGQQRPMSWHDLHAKLADRLQSLQRGLTPGPGQTPLQFLISAHAAHEEMFLVRRLAEDLMGPEGLQTIAVSWRYGEKSQPESAKFKVPPVDAPNVNGARLLGLVAGGVGDETRTADITALRQAVEAGRVAALYVLDPGCEGTLGDMQWVVDARNSGALKLLIVQGVLLTPLARAADFVLPGASYVEKEASYTNGQGRLQGTARAIPPPGDAMEDWQILVNLARSLGLAFDYAAAAHVRADIAARYPAVEGLAALPDLTFNRPMSARHWLQASNPSERWKWDFMFQDLPPVKGALDPTSLPMAPGMIALREVK